MSFDIVADMSQLDTTPWGKYIDLVYGKDTFQDTDFPIDPSSFLILYTDYLEQCGIPFEKYNLSCPDKTVYNKLLYNMSREHDPPHSVWLTKPDSYQKKSAIPAHTYVEVTHCIDAEVLENEKCGSWMYLAKGSGIYFCVGNTIAFNDHNDAVNCFLPGKQCHKPAECGEFFPDLVNEAKQKSYDSIQFLNHYDMRCDYIALKIIDLNGSGIYPCPIDGEVYATGYNARKSLSCDNTQKCLNRNG